MHAKKIKCTVTALSWLSEFVFQLDFTADKKLKFEAGQFISVLARNEIKRAYSFACSPEMAASTGNYSLCVRLVPGGAGSEFLSKLKVGDSFRAMAPYGNFVLHPLARDRGICFICTSTGIAPFRGMAYSDELANGMKRKKRIIFGARAENEILYPGEFEKLGFERQNVLSQQQSENHFFGRIPNYLASLPNDFAWHDYDYYLCGNPDMIVETLRYLSKSKGVSQAQIHVEYFAAPSKKEAPIQIPAAKPKAA